MSPNVSARFKYRSLTVFFQYQQKKKKERHYIVFLLFSETDSVSIRMADPLLANTSLGGGWSTSCHSKMKFYQMMLFFRIVEWGGDWTTRGTNSLRPSACCSKMVDTSRYKYNYNLWALNLSFEFLVWIVDFRLTKPYEIWNYQSLTDWPTHWLTGVTARRCYCI